MSDESYYPPVLPEWVGGAGKNAHYAPPDIGSQASQLNYVQDMMGMGMNPLMLWLSGQMNNGMLASTYEAGAGGRLDGTDEIIKEANTEGRSALENVMRTSSPDSPEYAIAEYILAGGSPIQAVQVLEQSGKIAPTMRDVYKDGQVMGQEPDTSVRDYYTKWATDAYNKLLADTDEVRQPAKEVLHPFVQSMLDAGFSDPRQQYTADGSGGNYAINPNLQGMDERVAAQQPGVDQLLKQRDLMSQFVAQSRNPTPQRGQRPQGIEEQRHNVQPAWMGHQVGDPAWRQIAEQAPPPPMPHPDMGGIRFNAIPQGSDISARARSNAQPHAYGSAVDAANMFERRMAGGYRGADPNREAMRKHREDVGRKAQQANMKQAKDKNSASLSRIKATAVENYLRSQGRSPARDEYAAAMQRLQQMVMPIA